MSHLSFYWLPETKHKLIQGLESEFAQLVELSISTGKISLPPIPDVVLKIQRLCLAESTSISDVADCLIEDPGLSAIVIRVAAQLCLIVETLRAPILSRPFHVLAFCAFVIL